jgi:ketosteroid isomerase-like protein
MSAHEDEAAIRRAYDAFSRGDMATLTELIAEDATWHVAGRNRWSGTKRGRDAIFAYFGELGAVGIKVELHDVVSNDRHTVGLHRATGEHGGRRLEENVALVFHLRGGKIHEAWEQGNDTRAIDEYIA